MAGNFFYFSLKIKRSHGINTEDKIFVVEKGENVLQVGKKLKEGGFVFSKYGFVYYMWKEDLIHSMVAGKYEIASNLTIAEIAKRISTGEIKENVVKLTFPEGWTARQIAERLTANGFNGEDFLRQINSPNRELISQYPFLADLPEQSSLEGYLFPDTYYFAKDATVDDIINKMLKNFDKNLSNDLKEQIQTKKKSVFEIITMASIIETEVPDDADRRIVSGLFWKRIEIGQRLQSDATLAYILGGKRKRQHSIEETQNPSPYNTYRHEGLPPGPISNPGISSIYAAINPENSNYLYFLSDTSTGKTIFSKTFEEHVANKTKYGL